MKNKKEAFLKWVLTGIIALIVIGNVSAFAISSDYWSGYPLQMYPSESQAFSITLQNVGGTSDLKLRAVVTTGSDILQIADSNNIYIVPAGQMGSANFVATLPADAKPGQVYPVKIDFSEIKDSSSGEFGLGTAIGQRFDIIALSPYTEAGKLPLITIVLLIAAGIALVAVIVLLVLRLKKKKHRLRKRVKGRRSR